MSHYGSSIITFAANPVNFGLVLLEIIFIFIVAVLATIAWRRYWGGRFGKGMGWLAISLYIMGVGHISYFWENIFGKSLFDEIFGPKIGLEVLLVALVVTWLCAILAFRAFLKEIKIPLH